MDASEDRTMLIGIISALSLLAGVALTFGAIYKIRPEYLRLVARIARFASIDLEVKLPAVTGTTVARSSDEEDRPA
jgi:hypothetical protein